MVLLGVIGDSGRVLARVGRSRSGGVRGADYPALGSLCRLEESTSVVSTWTPPTTVRSTTQYRSVVATHLATQSR